MPIAFDACYHLLMGRAGFVLTGGESRRMGRDKALLRGPGGVPLAAQIAETVLEAAGSVVLIGPPERYAHLGFQVLADRVPGCGPLGGVYTALFATSAEWNLVVACDMPNLTATFLSGLLAAAEASTADCMVPEDAAGMHPLCAVYHSRCRPAAEAAIRHNQLKMHTFVSSLRFEKWTSPEALTLANVNTPEHWKTLSGRTL
jgi:molybdopterin-guanine dinucleotide biosynthesis protein A